MTLLLRSVLLVQNQSGVSKRLAVASRRLLCASARLAGSCSCWACCGLHGNGTGGMPRRWCGSQATPPECMTDLYMFQESKLPLPKSYANSCRIP